MLKHLCFPSLLLQIRPYLYCAVRLNHLLIHMLTCCVADALLSADFAAQSVHTGFSD